MITHRERGAVALPIETLYTLFADVECYPDFLPGWYAARVVRQEGDWHHVEQEVGFRLWRERFRSTAHLVAPERIEIRAHGQAFEHFALDGWFKPTAYGCEIVLQLELQLRMWLMQQPVRALLHRHPAPILELFLRRSGHGNACLKPLKA